MASEVWTTIDVREIPKPERHPRIHDQYGAVPVGTAMDIVAPHEPRPLRREFQQRYGDAFSWEIRELEQGRCRVRITKDQETETEESTDSTDGTDDVQAPF